MGATQPCGVPPRPIRLRLQDRRIVRGLRPQAIFSMRRGASLRSFLGYSSAGRHGSHPFHAVADGYRRQAAVSLISFNVRILLRGQALAHHQFVLRDRLAQREAMPPALNSILGVQDFPQGKKNPGGLRTDQGLLPIWKVQLASLPDLFSRKAYLMGSPQSNPCETTLERSGRDRPAREIACPMGLSTGLPVCEPQAAIARGFAVFQFMGRAV